MSEHHAKIAWKLDTDSFDYKAYNREHRWEFQGGETVRASAAPAFLGKPEFVDPEEALVAALSACHMLTFLAIAPPNGPGCLPRHLINRMSSIGGAENAADMERPLSTPPSHVVEAG